MTKPGTDTDTENLEPREILGTPSGNLSNSAQQQELPLAFIAGEPITEIPKDLYIPPDALEVFLEAFEGPLDLLLYLIKRQNINILEIQIAEITNQYMAYVELMEASQFELAAEYLVMAAMLAEIKSRILLPRHEDERAEVINEAKQVTDVEEVVTSILLVSDLSRKKE